MIHLRNLKHRLSLKFAWVAPMLLLSALAQANALLLSEERKTVEPDPKDERVYLVHADKLEYDQYSHAGAQRLTGRVEFRHGGMRLTCDSARLYEASNSFEAFGHVRMTQGDTLSLTGRQLYYYGDSYLAQARFDVVLKHRTQTLTTDSLDYDRRANWAYFLNGGKLVDGDNTLTANTGDYYTDERTSSFFSGMKGGELQRVVLLNPKFTLVSDSLYYDTETKWAEIMGNSTIDSEDSHIDTKHAYYNTQTEQVQLFSRSEVTSDGRHMVGDSIYYDKLSGDLKAFRNIIYTDTVHRQIMTGDYCHYNELSGNAIGFDRALIKDFSSGTDTLYVHADTLRLKTYNMGTDSVRRELHAYFHVRAYRSDVQAVADSMVYLSDLRRLTLYRDPIAWSDNRQILGEEISVYSNDSTIDSIYVERQAILIEQIDTIHYNQVSGQLMRSYFENGEMSRNHVDGNAYVVNYPLEKDSTVLYQNYTEAPALRMTLKNRRMQRLWGGPAPKGCFYVAGLAPAERTFLTNFAWFDYIRPLDCNDLFEWRPKKQGTQLKPSVRHSAPMQILEKKTAPKPSAPQSATPVSDHPQLPNKE